MLRQVLHSRENGDGISSFQAFCIGLARAGTGNIAGVAIALTVGGPGAIFWMWVVAAIGMATALIEATWPDLQVRADDGSFPWRPAFTSSGLGSRKMARACSSRCCWCSPFGFAFNILQANAISDVLNTSHEIECIDQSVWCCCPRRCCSAGSSGGQGRRVRVAADGAGLRRWR